MMVRMDVMEAFSAATRQWFAGAFAAPTQAQTGAWAAAAAGEHALVIAPTGSGKTLAAFLWALDRLAASDVPLEARRRCRVLYVSPLKALAVDVERNLRAPLAGIRQAAHRLGLTEPSITVGMRTGDTSPEERRAFGRTPPDVLVTTPESLFLLLTSSARESLRGVETVIIDEVHAVAGTKRGAHMALSLDADQPAPPPPLDPTAPVSTGSGGGGDGSGDARRNILIGVAVLVVVGLVAFLAISGNDDDSTSNAVADRIVASLDKSQPEISKKDATCMADHIVDEVGADRLKGVDWDSDTTPPGKLGSDITDAYAEAFSKCHVSSFGSDGGSNSTDSDSTDSSDSNTGGLGDIGDVDAFKDLLAKQYQSTLGLSEEKATCLADAMGKAVKEGKLDQQDAFGDFFDYLEDCHISLSELRGAPTG